MNRSASRSSYVLIFDLLFCAYLTGGHLVAQLAAQDLDNTTLSGRVLDKDRAAIPGAMVQVMSPTGDTRRVIITDAEGKYRMVQLVPGSYILRAQAPGFALLEQSITTIAGQNVQCDLTLSLEHLRADPVIVKATVASVDTTRMVVGGTVTAQQVELLPIASRSPLDLVFTLPGVSEEPFSTRDLAEDRNVISPSTPEESGSFSLSGGPAYSNNITIDGLDNNDDRSARERFQPSIEAVEEVQVITNQFSAEYGRASGGRINIRTRSGSDQFHGRIAYFFRDESLNANTFRNNMNGFKRLPLQEHNPAVTLGGPVVVAPNSRARTFFFAAYEYDKLLDHTFVDTLVPVQQSKLFPLPAPTDLLQRRFETTREPAVSAEVAPYVSSQSTPLRNRVFTVRLDHQFSQNHSGAFLYQLGRLKNLRQSSATHRLAQAWQARTRNSDALSYSDNHVFSASAVNEARVQFSRLAPTVSAPNRTTPVVIITINAPASSQDSTENTLLAGSSNAGATNRREYRLQAQDVLAYVRSTHSVRFGVDVQRVRSTFKDLDDSSGTFNFASAGDFLAARPSRFRQQFLTESQLANTYLGLFIQDDWNLLPNLTLDYGVRYETESIVRDRNNFGPRFALAYAPSKSGRAVIRFGAGMFYNRALLRTIDDFTLGIQQLFFDTNALRDPAAGRTLRPDERRAFINANIHFPDALTVDSPLVGRFAALNTGFSRRLDPRLRIPESLQTNVGIETYITRGFVAEANYTINRGVHLWRELNVNAPQLPAHYTNFAQYLSSRDFPNFRNGISGLRPVLDTTSAGELVRFALASVDAANPNTIGRRVEFGLPISIINLNSTTSSTAIEAARAAISSLRPDPTRAEIEQLISAGNSSYHGLTLELRKEVREGTSQKFFLRAAYTLSSLNDDGTVNTSDALRPGDFRLERARSLLDRRHRFVFSGAFELPGIFANLCLAPVLRVASGAPFNISSGGMDRNLDDVSNDRPNFRADVRALRWRKPGKPLDPFLVAAFSLPTIGQTGDLPRNAGRGPGLFLFDLNLTREFSIGHGIKARLVFEFDNVLNKTVFSYGTEFINFSALDSAASAKQRQDVLDTFLVTTRTLRPRQLRLGIRMDF